MIYGLLSKILGGILSKGGAAGGLAQKGLGGLSNLQGKSGITGGLEGMSESGVPGITEIGNMYKGLDDLQKRVNQINPLQKGIDAIQDDLNLYKMGAKVPGVDAALAGIRKQDETQKETGKVPYLSKGIDTLLAPISELGRGIGGISEAVLTPYAKVMEARGAGERKLESMKQAALEKITGIESRSAENVQRIKSSNQYMMEMEKATMERETALEEIRSEADTAKKVAKIQASAKRYSARHAAMVDWFATKQEKEQFLTEQTFDTLQEYQWAARENDQDQMDLYEGFLNQMGFDVNKYKSTDPKKLNLADMLKQAVQKQLKRLISGGGNTVHLKHNVESNTLEEVQ